MVFSIICRIEVIPSDWKKGILVPVFKGKGSRTDCSNYRGITLLSVPGKLFAMLPLKRATSFLHTLCRQQQAGFMPGRSTTEQIHTVKQIVEKTVEFQQKSLHSFHWLSFSLWHCWQTVPLAHPESCGPTRKDSQPIQRTLQQHRKCHPG